MAFGVMGGAMQPQGHIQIVINLVDFGMDLQEAGDADRFRHSGSSSPTGTAMTDGGTVHLESGVSTEIRRELMRRGHRIQELAAPGLRWLPGHPPQPRNRRLRRRDASRARTEWPQAT